MALKELSVKEALKLLAEKYPEPVEGWFWHNECAEKNKGILDIDTGNKKYVFKIKNAGNYPHFAIEVEPEYRYMTQQEVVDWVCLHGYKGYQMKPKGGNTWWKPYDLENSDDIERYQYRTIQEIDGKIVYGEPQEFKVRV